VTEVSFLESIKVSGPLAVALGLGCIALWRAWALERAEVKRLNERFTQFLLDTLQSRND
jgi:hypothetical protein